MFAPSLKLLTKWHLEKFMLNERTWDAVRVGMPATGSPLPRHPHSYSVVQGDPNDDKNEEALLQWLALSGLFFLGGFCFCFCLCHTTAVQTAIHAAIHAAIHSAAHNRYTPALLYNPVKSNLPLMCQSAINTNTHTTHPPFTLPRHIHLAVRYDIRLRRRASSLARQRRLEEHLRANADVAQVGESAGRAVVGWDCCCCCCCCCC